MTEPIQTTRMRRLPTVFGVLTTFSDETLDVKRFAQGNWLKSLTERETEVLRLLAQGQSNKQIACSLNNTEQTIKSHVSRILSKLGCRAAPRPRCMPSVLASSLPIRLNQAATLHARHDIAVATELCDEPDLPLPVKED
ncbi:MAG TPA: helix-turn-helix transcriptional regulator [Ktedonobacteraceae bacterium]